MRRTFERKRNRLPLDVYEGSKAYSVTTTVQGRRPLFNNDDIVQLCLEKLNEASTQSHFQVLAYCFMPDHLHLLLQSDEDTKLIAFMRTFKQISGYAYRRATGDTAVLWQKSYYDHVLRKEEDLQTVANYIWGNPVRAGLVENSKEYPYSGSLVLSGVVDGGLKPSRYIVLSS